MEEGEEELIQVLEDKYDVFKDKLIEVVSYYNIDIIYSVLFVYVI